MAKVRRWLADLPFRKKLQLAFILVIMVPTILMGGYFYASAIAFVQEQQVQELDNVLSQNVLDINSKMEQCETSLTYAVANYSLQEFLSDDSLSPLEVTRQANAYIGPLLYNILLSGQYLDRMTIYIPRSLSVLGDLIKSNEDVEATEWYQTSLASNESHWWYEDGNFYLTRKISGIDNVGDIGVMRIRIKPDLFYASFKNYLYIPMDVKLQNEDEVLYRYNALGETGESGNTYVRELKSSGWSLQYDVEKSYFSAFSNRRLVVAVLLAIVSLSMVAVIVSIVSKSLVRRILALSHQMQQVQAGKLDVEVEDMGGDEIGQLAENFQSMLDQINTLIIEVYEAELQHKNLQLQLLQSKLNPHFLYNNLSAISWLARSKGQDEICEITNQLSAFYRTALNRGKEMSTLGTEMQNADAYMKLQLIAHEESFIYSAFVEERLLGEEVPGFILQPLLENAIEHGIELRREPGGIVEIKAEKHDGELLIYIFDNGTQLCETVGNGIMSEEKYGYGLSNVHQRLQLYYGKKSGVKVLAHEKGTQVTITIPAQNK